MADPITGILATVASVAPIVDTLITVGKLVFKAVHSRKKKKQHIDEETAREERRLLAMVQRSRPEIYGELQQGLRMAGTYFARGDDIATSSLRGILSKMNQSVAMIQGYVSAGRMMFRTHDYHSWNAIGANATRDTVNTLSQLLQRNLQAAPIPRSLGTDFRRRLEDIPNRKQMTNNDGSTYEGQWKKGAGANGYGKWTSSDGLETYEGDFIDNLYGGYGTAQWARHSKRSNGGQKSYTGTFEMGKIHGFGKAVYYDGTEYEGEYKFDMRDGYGKTNFSNGHTYEGQYRQNARHGFGIYTSPGEKYEGEWEWGNKQGRGSLTFVDGLVYEGTWHDNKYHGYGIMIVPRSGWTFEGYWDCGKKEGFGHETWASGDWREAIWSNDQITQVMNSGKTAWVKV